MGVNKMIIPLPIQFIMSIYSLFCLAKVYYFDFYIGEKRMLEESMYGFPSAMFFYLLHFCSLIFDCMKCYLPKYANYICICQSTTEVPNHSGSWISMLLLFCVMNMASFAEKKYNFNILDLVKIVVEVIVLIVLWYL